MSQFGANPFKLLAVNFPVRVNVTATQAINEQYGSAWSTYSQMVLDKIRTEPVLQGYMNSLNRDSLDARTNSPYFRTDNSAFAPDNHIDYTILIWRYAGGSPGRYGPFATDSLHKAVGSGGGYASVNYATLIPATGTRAALTTSDGFTQCAGMSGINHELFVHEFAHTMYGAAHVNGNNGVCGNKFYVTTGNSMTTGNINAWERWFLGWAPLMCNGVSGDLTGPAALTPTRRYWLRDFITSGDALRIRLPNTYDAATGTYQYLWLENRQKKSIWDQRQWTVGGAGQPLPVIPPGIMAYIEDMGQNKVNPTGYGGFNRGANGLKYFSAAGHYDFEWLGTSSLYNYALWNNRIYDFVRRAAKPTGGQSTFMFLRGDKDQKGTIEYTIDSNTGGYNEYFHYSALNNTPNYGFMGHDARYIPTNKLGLDTNPALVSVPDFDEAQQQMKPMQLNGVSVRFLDYNSTGDILVEVSFTDTDIAQSTRWTGNLNLWDTPGAANGYDANILAGVQLRVDRSGTPNRSTSRVGSAYTPDFINPTRLNVVTGATMHVQTGGSLLIGAGSTVFVEDGALLLADQGASVQVEAGALLSVKTQAEADALQQYGQLQLQAGGNLEIRDNGVVGRPGASLSVFPNPTQSQQLRVELQGVPAAQQATYSYRLLTPYGQAVRQGKYTSPALSLVGVPAGTYLLELTNPAGKRLTSRVQVNP